MPISRRWRRSLSGFATSCARERRLRRRERRRAQRISPFRSKRRAGHDDSARVKADTQSRAARGRVCKSAKGNPNPRETKTKSNAAKTKPSATKAKEPIRYLSIFFNGLRDEQSRVPAPATTRRVCRLFRRRAGDPDPTTEGRIAQPSDYRKQLSRELCRTFNTLKFNRGDGVIAEGPTARAMSGESPQTMPLASMRPTPPPLARG